MYMYMYNCFKLNCIFDVFIIIYSIVYFDLKCICILYIGINIIFYNINVYVEKYFIRISIYYLRKKSLMYFYCFLFGVVFFMNDILVVWILFIRKEELAVVIVSWGLMNVVFSLFICLMVDGFILLFLIIVLVIFVNNKGRI